MTSNQQRNHDTLILVCNSILTNLETCKKMGKQRKKKEKNAFSLRESCEHNDGVVMTIE